jgi:hypothetical protein
MRVILAIYRRRDGDQPMLMTCEDDSAAICSTIAGMQANRVACFSLFYTGAEPVWLLLEGETPESECVRERVEEVFVQKRPAAA